MGEKFIQKNRLGHIPFDTLVQYTMGELSEDVMKEVREKVEQTPYNLSIVRGIRKTADQESLTSAGEVSEWYNKEAEELKTLLSDITKTNNSGKDAGTFKTSTKTKDRSS